MKKRFISMICAVLLLSLTLGATGASASGIQPHASSYLFQYSASVTAAGSGQVKIDFEVDAMSLADLVGATSIVVQKKNGSSWTNVQTYAGTTANSMLGSDCLSHCSSKTYSGTSGGEYRAVVTVYAKIGSGSDSKSVTTNSIIA
jgi:hypothetical protein